MSSTSDESDSSRHSEKRTDSGASADLPTLPDGTAFRLLENRRRRYLLYCLLDYDGEVTLPLAVDTVTAWENDCPVEDVRSTDRRCVYSTLRRTHVPKLESEGVVAYDEDAGTVSFGPDAEKATRWLNPDERWRWSKHYLGLASVTAVFVGVDHLAELPSLLPEGAEHATVAVAFLALTAFVVYDELR